MNNSENFYIKANAEPGAPQAGIDNLIINNRQFNNVFRNPQNYGYFQASTPSMFILVRWQQFTSLKFICDFRTRLILEQLFQ